MNTLLKSGTSKKIKKLKNRIWNHFKEASLAHWLTGPDGAVVMSSAKGLAGTGFASQYRL